MAYHRFRKLLEESLLQSGIAVALQGDFRWVDQDMSLGADFSKAAHWRVHRRYQYFQQRRVRQVSKVSANPPASRHSLI
jgi:hypothetical protein